MVNVFTSNNFATFGIAKSLLKDRGILFVPKGDDLRVSTYMAYDIFVKEEDAHTATEILKDIVENHVHLNETVEKKHKPFFGILVIAGIIITVAILFWLGLWLREIH